MFENEKIVRGVKKQIQSHYIPSPTKQFASTNKKGDTLLELLGINNFNNVFYINVLNNEYKQQKISGILKEMGFTSVCEDEFSPKQILIRSILDAVRELGYTPTAIYNSDDDTSIKGYVLQKIFKSSNLFL